MRFLIGLIAGAMAALFVATAVDAPTEQVVDQGVQAWQQAKAHFAAAVAEPERALPLVEHPHVAAAAPAVPGPVPLSVAARADEETAPQAASVEKGGDTHDEIATLGNVDISRAAAAAPPQHRPADAYVAPPAAADEGTQSVGDFSSGLQPRPQAVVWAPFHSEASARGFAARLSNQLARPFNVMKEGPAQYLVTYEYDDEIERHELERQIAYVTGAASP